MQAEFFHLKGDWHGIDVKAARYPERSLDFVGIDVEPEPGSGFLSPSLIVVLPDPFGPANIRNRGTMCVIPSKPGMEC